MVTSTIAFGLDSLANRLRYSRKLGSAKCLSTSLPLNAHNANKLNENRPFGTVSWVYPSQARIGHKPAWGSMRITAPTYQPCWVGLPSRLY
eukprot:scaffold18862_cov55-Attheya_sp.AAC.6